MSRKAFSGPVTDTSTVLSDMGEIGDKRFVDGQTYRLVYAATTQAANAILALDSTDATMASYTVQALPASSSPFWGINATGATLASGTYFWSLVEGPYVANSDLMGNLSATTTEKYLAIDSDKKIGLMGTVTSDATSPVVGASIVAVTSVDSTQGTPTIYIKGLGA